MDVGARNRNEYKPTQLNTTNKPTKTQANFLGFIWQTFTNFHKSLFSVNKFRSQHERQPIVE